MSVRKASAFASAALLTLVAGCAPMQISQITDVIPGYTSEKPKPSIDVLVDKLVQADYVILGEKHDNPEHHKLQLEILKKLNKRGWLKQVSMEMLTPSQQSDVDMATEKRIEDFYGLEQVLQWEKGWNWELYGPIVSWAVSEGVPLKAANLDEAELKNVRLKPDRLGQELLGQHGVAIHRKQFRDSHCGHVDRKREESMLRVQVSRDARMAASMTAKSKGVVLLAGSWHARKDIGVPRYVHLSTPDAKIISVGMVERPLDEKHNLDKQFDLVWMTDGVERPDYCEMFRNRTLKKP